MTFHSVAQQSDFIPVQKTHSVTEVITIETWDSFHTQMCQ